MNARPQIAEVLIAKKIKRWLMIAKHPLYAPGIPPAIARKRYWALCKKYRHVMERLKLSETSPYE